MPISETEIREWAIYKITNPIGGIYIGRTCNIKTRLLYYKNLHQCVSRQRRVYESLIEYGYDLHKVEVIDSFKSNISYAHGKEIFWIRTNMSNGNKYPEMNGLNCGNGGRSNSGIVHTQEMNDAKSKLFKGKIISESQREMARIQMTGKPGIMLGKNHTDESRAKMSKSKKGQPSPHKGKTYDMAYSLNNSKSQKGKPSPHKGRKVNAEMLAKIALTRNTKKKTVLLYNDEGVVVKEFRSIREVSRHFDLGTTLIKRILNGFNDNIVNNQLIKFKC